MDAITLLTLSPNHRLVWRKDMLGFTLIELIVTVLVAGILAAAAIPAYTSLVASQRVKTSSFDIMSALILTRSEALKRNVGVSIAPIGGNWTNGMQIITTDASATVISKLNPAKGVLITCKQSGVTVTCPSFTYNPSGRIAGTVATSIQISNTAGTNQRCISINLSGRPNAKTGACT